MIGPSSANAAPRVQVRGTTRLEVHASGPRERIQVSGTLRDETGTPVADALLVLSAMADASAPTAWEAMGSCAEEGPPTSGGRTEHTETTDSMGGFCIITALRRGEAAIRVVFGGGPLHEGTRTEVLWNAQQRPLSLQFAPRPERVDLDAQRVLVFARAIPPAGVSTQGLTLDLTGSEGRALASEQTDASGSAHFDFPSSLLEGPGIGALRVSFAGREDLAATSATATITRTVRVRLASEKQELTGDPTRGITVRVSANTSRGPASGGTVEATLEHDVIGVGAVVDGAADVVLTFRPRRDASKHNVTFRYRSDAPYFEQSGTIGISVIASQPSPWLRAVPVVLVVLVAAWLLRGWWRPRRRERKTTPRPTVTGEPSLAIVGASRSRSSWSGRVVDAHDGEPIAGARVRVVVPTFVEMDVVVDEVTDEGGGFSFEVRSREKQLQLLVDSTYHAEMVRPLPPPSDVVVALVNRRRLLLDRLVKWARRAGKPWHHEAGPTPGHVVRVAKGRRRDADVGVWAERIERGAYGPNPVDQRLEREVNDLEPGGH